MKSKEMRLMGFTDMKLKIIDVLIKESIINGGYFKSEQLISLKKELEDYAMKQEMLEELEDDKVYY